MATTMGLGGLSGRFLVAVAVGYTRGHSWGAYGGSSWVIVPNQKWDRVSEVLDMEYSITLRVFCDHPSFPFSSGIGDWELKFLVNATLASPH